MDVKGIVTGAQEAEDAINKVNDAVEGKQPGQKGNRPTAAGKASADWKSLGGLFTGFLPRSFQKGIRTIKSANRAVKGATRGVQTMGKAMKNLAGPIIGALLIGIELLIENWDKVTNFLGLVSYGQRAVNEAMEEGEKAANSLTAANETYLAMLLDTNRALDERLVAQRKLAKSIEAIGDIDLNAEDAQEQIQAAFDLEVARVSMEAELESMSEAYAKYAEERDEELADIEKGIERYGNTTNLDTRNATIRLNRLNEDYAEMLERRTEIINTLTEQEVQRVEAEEAAQAAAQAAAAQQKTQDRVEALSAETRLNRIKDKSQRELVILREKQEAEEAAFEASGATEEQLLVLQEYYANKRMEIRQKEIDAQRAEAERAGREMLALQQEIEEILTTDAETRALAAAERKYEKLIENAKAAGLETLELEQALQDELIKISEEFTQKEEDKKKSDADAAAKEALQEERERRQAGYLVIADDEERQRQIELDNLKAKYEENLALLEKFEMDSTALTAKYESEREDIIEGSTDEAIMTRKEGLKELEGGMEELFNSLQGLAERGSKRAKQLAVIEVLLNQAKALSAGIRAAIEVTPTASGPAYPFVLAGYIASIAGTILTGFTQVKSILSESGASGGGSLGQQRSATSALVPSVSGGMVEQRSMNVNAYVVQSDLQGQNMMANNIFKRVSL